MIKAVRAFAQTQTPQLETLVQRLRNTANTLFHDRFKFQLWEDIMADTGVFVDGPKADENFLDYTIRALGLEHTYLKMDKGGEINEGDVVAVGIPAFGSFSFYGGYNRGTGIGVVTAKRQSHWDGTQTTVRTCEEQANYDPTSLQRLIPTQSPGTKIRVGDYVALRQRTDMAEIVDEEPFEEEDPLEILAEEFETGNYRGGKSHIRVMHNSAQKRRGHVEATFSGRYLVLKREGKRVCLYHDYGVETVSIKEVRKNEIPGPNETPADAFRETIRKTVYDYYERKGIFRKSGVVRQLLTICGPNFTDEADHQIYMAEIDYDQFLKCCEVMKNVARPRR
jgi:hypothetical protein